MREGLFSSDAFVAAAKGFVLLRLKPGPAESLFGITAAPNAVVADWHGRVTVGNLNLRGDSDGACARLRTILDRFDRKAAARPPYAVPAWAKRLVTKDGLRAMEKYLRRVHPRAGKAKPNKRAFKNLRKLYRSLDRDGELICFCANYFTACEKRIPAAGVPCTGYEAEVEFLEEITFCRNDRIKFDAIACHGRFAPIDRIGFCLERAEKRREGCRNPNIILCRAMAAIGDMAARFPGVTDGRTARQRRMILDTLPAMIDLLDTEGRNNGACRYASRSIEIIAERTGAPEALAAYIHNFKAPKCDSQWMIDYTARYHETALQWIRSCTGQDLGVDFDGWSRWYGKNADALFYDGKRKVFVVDAKAARTFRKELEKSSRK